MSLAKITRVSDDRALSLLHERVFERLGDRELKRSYYLKDSTSKTNIEYDLGYIEVIRDINTLSIEARTDNGDQIVKFRLRDRRFDGSPNYDSPLTEWPYNAEADKVEVPSLEISRYSRDPDLYWPEPDLREFLREPFDFIFGDEGKFIDLFYRAFESGHFPGQSALPLRGAAKFFKEESVKLAEELDYRLTASPSHLYVAQSDKRNGFIYQSSLQEKEIRLIEEKLDDFNLSPFLKKQQSSWICLLQKFPSLRESELSKFYLEGLEYPLFYDGTHVENVWMVYGGRSDFSDLDLKECKKRLDNYDRRNRT